MADARQRSAETARERPSACAEAAARYVARRFGDETPQQRREFNDQLVALIQNGRLTK